MNCSQSVEPQPSDGMAGMGGTAGIAGMGGIAGIGGMGGIDGIGRIGPPFAPFMNAIMPPL